MDVNQSKSPLIPTNRIYQSYRRNKNLVKRTPLIKSIYLSQKYGANIYLKRQDLQDIRSFKIRGAATAFSYLDQQQKARGVVTASAGNHAQGIAYCCNKFKIRGTIFMPENTPKLKINSVRNHGGDWLDLKLIGTTFDDAVNAANEFKEKTNAVFIHAFDNLHVIQGQGGVACEILQDWTADSLDYVFICCGGGGLLSGVSCYMKDMSPQTIVIGFEPLGSPSMYDSLKQNMPIVLKELQTFVDGASMKKASKFTFEILRELKIPVDLVDEGLVAKTMLDIYENQSIILQPAGALSIAGLQLRKNQIKGKNIVCVLSGSNNDISRLPQIRLRCRIYENKESYYVVSSSSPLNILTLVDQTINPEEQEIILMNSAKKYNVSASECVIGLEFFKPEYKKDFERRAAENKYKLTELKAKDPLLKILL